MQSVQAITEEIDDVELATQDLLRGVQGSLPDAESRLGILFCDADLDGAAVTGRLRGALGFDVVGMTARATLSRQGYHEFSALLMVLGENGCTFVPAVSEPLVPGRHLAEIRNTFARALQDDTRMFMAFCPFFTSISGDDYIKELNRLAPDVPLMGGMISDDFDCTQARVFFSGKEYTDSLLAISFSGKVSPSFAVRHSVSRFSDSSQTVTRSQSTTVWTVGNKTFVDYLQSIGLDARSLDTVATLFPFPLQLSPDDDDTVSLLRNITEVDLATGTGFFLGDIPEGTIADVCLINKDNLDTSCRDTLQCILQTGQKEGLINQTVFVFSCCGRTALLGDDAGLEGRIIGEMLPEGVALQGAYCQGELCPARTKTGALRNHFHNSSFVCCIL